MNHRIVLLKIMEQLVNENLAAIKPDFAATIANFAISEMTADKV